MTESPGTESLVTESLVTESLFTESLLTESLVLKFHRDRVPNDGQIRKLIYKIDSRSSDRDSANLPDGIESLEGFVISLYQEVFTALVYLINRLIRFFYFLLE